MMPDQWTARLSEYVDDELDPAERRALEAHLPDCADCRETVAELRRVALKAGALADREPETDLWPGIARRIGAVVESAPAVRPIASRRWSLSLPQLAAAGLALAALGAGGFWALQGALRGPDRQPVVERPAPGGEGVLVLARGDESTRDKYDRAVAELQQVLALNRSRLDTATVRVLEESLATIDRALARAREALSQDPSDAYLNAHLAETMRRKIDLLRRAAALATASS